MNKNIFFLSIAMVMSSCNMIESLTNKDSLYFDEHNFSYNDRLIMGNTLELRTYEDFSSPEIYVGTRKMDAEFTSEQDPTTGSTIKVIRIDFPEDIEDGMYSGIEGNVCTVHLRSHSQNGKKTYENVIAVVHLYKQFIEFIDDNLAVGTPVTAETGDAYCIYLDSRNEEIPEEINVKFGYDTPMKIAGSSPERLIFRDADGTALSIVAAQQVMSASEDYIYAELEYLTGIDTVYTDYSSSLGSAYQSFNLEEKDVLIRKSDGKLIEMPATSIFVEKIDHYGHFFQWISEDLFYFSEAVRSNDQMPKIRLYSINDDYIYKEREFSTGEYPENVGTFSWVASENSGIIINKLKYYSFKENRLKDHLYYERTDASLDMKYNEQIYDSYYFMTPFLAGDDNFYAIIDYRTYITGGYISQPCLYRMEEDAIFKHVADLDIEKDQYGKWNICRARCGNDTYIFWTGGGCIIDASGNVNIKDYPELFAPSIITPNQYWPYNTGKFLYASELDLKNYLVSLSGQESNHEPIEELGSGYWDFDCMGNVSIFMNEIDLTNARCKIMVSNEIIHDMTLEGLSLSKDYKWTITGQGK